MLLADATKVLAIGVSEYDDAGLRLKFAATNARALAQALLLDQGCRLPPDNVTLLCDSEASRSNLLREIRSVADNCASSDLLIIYFSGHGERLSSDFFLLPVDAVSRDLRHTAIAGDDLSTALSNCRARGILLVLDCCKSAGFAENAKAFFTTLSGHEFRLLLSASRDGQPSFEFEQAAGTLFTKALVTVLRGEAGNIGPIPGVVYFSDLFQYLQDHVAEGLESLGHPSTAQEPVFAGTFSRDPRLFILNRLSLENVEATTPRYSRRFVRRRVYSALAVFLTVFLLFLAGYYTYLDHSFYIWHEPGVVGGHEGDFLSIYQGDPVWNWLGFPHRVFTTDIAADGIASARRPGVGPPPVVHWSGDIRSVLFSNLSPDWQAAVSAWNQDPKAAWEYARSIDVLDDPRTQGQREAIGVLCAIATRSDLAALENFIANDDDSEDAVVLRRIAQLDASKAFDLLEEASDTPKNVEGVLRGLNAPCNDAIASFLSNRLPARFGEEPAMDAWLGAAIRTHCPLPASTLSKALEVEQYEPDRHLMLLPVILASAKPDFRVFLAEDLKRSIAAIQSGTLNVYALQPAVGKLWIELRTAAVLSPAAVPDSARSLLSKPYSSLRFAAAKALLAKSRSNEKMLAARYPGDPWIVGALIDSGWFDAAIVAKTMRTQVEQSRGAPGSRAAYAVMFLLRLLRLRQCTGATALVTELSRAKDAEIKIEALRTLDALGGRWAGEASNALRLDEIPKYSLLTDTFLWYVRNDDGAFRGFVDSLGEDSGEAAEVLGRTKLSPWVLAVLRDRLKIDRFRLQAAAVLAMRGDQHDLTSMLTSPDLNIRNQAMLYASYNPAIVPLLKDRELERSGAAAFSFVKNQQQLRSTLDRISESLPPRSRSIALSVLGGLREPALASSYDVPDVSPGVRLWLQDKVDSLQGVSEDDLERLRDDSPPPISP